jgi:four helix bundle protein
MGLEALGSREKSIKSYHDLEVWKRSRVFVKLVYQLTKRFPKEEVFALTSQMRRSAISIPSNIAEGYSRHGLKDYINFISIAVGSSAELETQLLLSQDLDYCDQENITRLLQELNQIQKMLHRLRQSLQSKL